jgi:hypothetical protein
MKKILIITMCVISLLCGCSKGEIESTNTIPEGTGYPAPGGEGYPAPLGRLEHKATVYPEGIFPPTPFFAPNVEKSAGAIFGVLFSINYRMTIPDTELFLRIVNDNDPLAFITGPDKSRGDIVGISDNQANFVIGNIPPERYWIIVWSPYGWDLANTSNTDTTPMIVTVQGNSTRNLGVVFVVWP